MSIINDVVCNQMITFLFSIELIRSIYNLIPLLIVKKIRNIY